MSTLSCRALAAMCTLVLANAALAGENWTRFRGPNGAGVAAESFPSAWTADDYLWKIALPGKGHGSPIGWNGLAFVTCGDPETGALSLVAIDVDSGETRWTKTFDGSHHSLHAANSYASGTPTVDAERVYVTWTANDKLHAAAVDHRGELVWQRELGPAEYRHGSGNSPILVGDLLVIANDHAGDSFVAGLDAQSGAERWRRARQGGIESYATPLVFEDDDRQQQIVVSSSAEGIAGLSPVDGSVLWQIPGIYLARCVNSPFIAAGMVLSGSGEGGNGKQLTAVRPASEQGVEPEVAFELKKSVGQVPTPVAVGDRLFVWSDRGVVACYNAADGAEIWSKRIGGNYYGSPVAAGGKIYCVAADGEVVCVAAADKFELLGRSQLGEGSHATPAIHQGKMLLRTESALACLPAE
ncbi:MAG: PQQ-like beta-propeller repeat protein [Planctomycetaceae bacterium]|jgi:outer membrane protein assembly factor BamB|nr:PQQ-like beta-propeller repeat protein [Planctomycetaceae bacterium]